VCSGVPDDGLDHPRGRVVVIVVGVGVVNGVVDGAVNGAPLDTRTLDILTTWVWDPPVHLRSPLSCNVPCLHLLRQGTSTLHCTIDGWYVLPNTQYSVTKLLLVTLHHLKRHLQLLLELCRVLLLLDGNNPGTSSYGAAAVCKSATRAARAAAARRRSVSHCRSSSFSCAAAAHRSRRRSAAASSSATMRRSSSSHTVRCCVAGPASRLSAAASASSNSALLLTLDVNEPSEEGEEET
jgi:hypothetical protein